MLDNTYGEHNINNACVAVKVCEDLGVAYSKIYRALKSFKPAGRRCEVITKIKCAEFLTDYAHHPSEIESLYKSLKLKYDKIYLIFGSSLLILNIDFLPLAVTAFYFIINCMKVVSIALASLVCLLCGPENQY